MLLNDRLNYCMNTCAALQATSSRLEKQSIVDTIHEDHRDDMNVIFEILDGRHNCGFTVIEMSGWEDYEFGMDCETSLRAFLEHNIFNRSATDENIRIESIRLMPCYPFLHNIINRVTTLGINPLEKSSYAPMLAERHGVYNFKTEKWELETPIGEREYITGTQKLDGFRCNCFFDDGKWKFMSRDNKPLPVDFLAPECEKTLNKSEVYDGELICIEYIIEPYIYAFDFEITSGNVRAGRNSHNLCFVLFDIQKEVPYGSRRNELEALEENDKVFVLPSIFEGHYGDWNIRGELRSAYLSGFEGLMINRHGLPYIHARTTALLKVKMVFELDMNVESFNFGKSGKKYGGIVGSLNCRAFINGETYQCGVSSGLSDVQRQIYTEVLPKVITVQFQSRRQISSGVWSLRHPRLLRVRTEKGFKAVKK